MSGKASHFLTPTRIYAAAPTANGNGEHAAAILPAACPDCGTPYGKIRRCFRCKPTTKKSTVPVVREQPPVVAEAAVAPLARPSSALRELDAMRSIVGALDGLDEGATRRVLAWVGWHFGTEAS